MEFVLVILSMTSATKSEITSTNHRLVSFCSLRVFFSFSFLLFSFPFFLSFFLVSGLIVRAMAEYGHDKQPTGLECARKVIGHLASTRRILCAGKTSPGRHLAWNREFSGF